MVQAILFDFWGTLVENGIYPSPVRQVKRIMNLHKTPFPEFIVTFEQAFMTQKYPDLYKAFEDVCKAFKINVDQRMLDDLVGMWNKNKLLAKPYPDVRDVLTDLRKEFKLALISNTDCFSVESVMEKYDLTRLFDATFLSYEQGILKSDPALFKKALKTLDAKKGDTIMVGDSLESDIKGAQEAGIRAILIDRKNRREFPDKIQSLSELPQLVREN
jgi:HAD superfamily hydrolase (TIGR01549 family)